VSAAQQSVEVERDDSLNELRATARVRALLRRDPSAALALLDRLAELHPRGYLVEERAALRVFALLAAGHPDEAEARARAFVREHPRSPFSAQLQKIAEH
jgi:outer membrane protein assembly factor BamD (BamD/ComL family)